MAVTRTLCNSPIGLSSTLILDAKDSKTAPPEKNGEPLICLFIDNDIDDIDTYYLPYVQSYNTTQHTAHIHTLIILHS